MNECYELLGKTTVVVKWTLGRSCTATTLKSPTTHIVEAATANIKLMVNKKHVQA